MAESQPDTGDTTQTATDTNEATADTAPDLAKEVEKWQALARKHEDRAKANATAAKELEKLRTESMSDMEKAIAQARQEAATEATKGFGARLVDAEVKAAAAGRPVDVDALLEGLDRNRFLTDDGEPDQAAISAWVDRIAPVRDEAAAVLPTDLGQGVRPGASAALNGDPLLRDLKSKLGIR